MTRETLLICPICRATLTREQNVLRCSRRHSYDIAKGGYVNLLLVNQKGSASPGDSKEMLVSRRNFLERGYYAPLSDWINHLVAAHLDNSFHAPGQTAAVLDAGCGEGYYLDHLRQYLAQHGEGASENDYYGLDISKEAVKLAAQRYKGITFLVTSLHQALPFPDASLDVLLSVFAPRNALEFARVLSLNGIVIAVIPAEGHLSQLQAALGLGKLKADKEQQIVESLQEFFAVTQAETLRYVKSLDRMDILNLIKMIPTGWQLSEATWSRARALDILDIEFAFTLVVLRRKAASGGQGG